MAAGALNAGVLVKGATMRLVVKIAAGTLMLLTVLQSAFGGDHHTLRFLYPDSRSAKSASSLAISPDGKEVALCVEPGTVHFIRTSDGEQVSQLTARPFVMKYSQDGSRVLMVSTDGAWIVETKTRRRVSVDTDEEPGYLGLKTVERNGKLIVERLFDGGSAAECGQLVVGDEVVAFADGKSAEMQNAIGLSAADFTAKLKGPVHTFVRIQVLHKGQRPPETVLLRRRAGRITDETILFLPRAVPPITDNLVLFQRGGRHTFVSAFDGTAIGSMTSEELQHFGQHAVSPDQRRFATLSFTTRDRNKYGIEVFDVTKMERTLSLPFDRRSFAALKFSADGKELLVGSRDRIDVIDVATGKFQRSYRLDGAVTTTSEDDHPKKNPVRLDGGVGNSVAGAAAADVGTIYEPPTHKVESIAVSQTLLAVASPWGHVDLWDLATGVSMKSFPLAADGQKIYGQRKVEVMEFSPDGRWFVFFVNGVLNIVDVADVKNEAKDG
jgi:WD40 repeat protein